MKIDKVFVFLIFSLFTIQKIVAMEEGLIKGQLGKEEQSERIEQQTPETNDSDDLTNSDALELIKSLLKQNINKEGFKKLNFSKNKIESLKNFVVKYKDSLKRNLLFKAKTANNVYLLVYLGLSDCGYYLDVFGNTPLNWATQNGRIEVASALIKYIDEDCPNDYGQSTFHNLVITQNIHLAHSLLTDDVTELDDAEISDSNINPLFLSARYNPDMLKILISSGKYDGKINMFSPSGLTPLMIACQYQPEIVEYLLQCGADVNLQGDAGKTPLMIACCHPELLQLLLNHGAKVNIRDNDGQNALMYAILQKRFLPIQKYDLNKNLEAIKVLINNGEYINNQDNDGITPLMLAVRNFPVVELLLNAGAIVNPS